MRRRDGVGRQLWPRRVRMRTVLEQAVVDPLSRGRAVAQEQRGAGREHFKVPEWTEARQRIAPIIASNCAAKYRVPTMLDGPVVDTHIFAFESCAA